MPIQFPTTTDGEATLDEILSEIYAECTAAGDPHSHPMLMTASAHGGGFLTGTAACLLDEAVGSDLLTAAEVDEYLVSAAVSLILAVIHRRKVDGALAQQELDNGPDGSGGAEAFPFFAFPLPGEEIQIQRQTIRTPGEFVHINDR